MKNGRLLLGTALVLAICFLAGNNIDGRMVGPFNLPPFFLALGFASGLWTTRLLEQFAAPKILKYIEARRSVWWRVILPTLLTTGWVFAFMIPFVASIWLAAPKGVSQAFLSHFGF